MRACANPHSLALQQAREAAGAMWLLMGVSKMQLPGSYSALHVAQQLLRHDVIRRQQIGEQAPQLQLLAPVGKGLDALRDAMTKSACMCLSAQTHQPSGESVCFFDTCSWYPPCGRETAHQF